MSGRCSYRVPEGAHCPWGLRLGFFLALDVLHPRRAPFALDALWGGPGTPGAAGASPPQPLWAPAASRWSAASPGRQPRGLGASSCGRREPGPLRAELEPVAQSGTAPSPLLSSAPARGPVPADALRRPNLTSQAPETAVGRCVSVSLELSRGDRRVTGSEAGGGGWTQSPCLQGGIREVSHQRPEQGCSCQAYLPTHSGDKNEDGSPRSRGSSLVTDAEVTGTGGAAGALSGPAGYKAHSCRGTREGRLKGVDERPTPARHAGAPRCPPRLCVWATRSLTAGRPLRARPACPFQQNERASAIRGAEAQERGSFFSKTFICDGLFF